MAEDGNLQQETDGQNSPTSSIDGNRSQDERETPSQRLTASTNIGVRRQECRDRRKEMEIRNKDALAPVFARGFTLQLFYEAVRKGKLNEVELILRRKDPIRMLGARFTPFEANAFQVAVAAGQKQMLRELIKKVNDIDHRICISMLKEKNTNGETILTLAIAQGSIDIVKELLDKCPELVDIPNKKGELPVTLAALCGEKREKEIVTTLFESTLGIHYSNPSGGDVEEDAVMTNSTQSSQDDGDFKVLKVSMTTQVSGHDERNYSFKLVSEDRDQAKPAYQSRHHCFRLFKACIRSRIYDTAADVFEMFPKLCIEEMVKDSETMNLLVVGTIELQKQRNFVTRLLESCSERWGESCKLWFWIGRCWKYWLLRNARSRYENSYRQPERAVVLLRWIGRYLSRLEIPDETVQRVLTKPLLTAVGEADATFSYIIGCYSELYADMIPLINPVSDVLGAIHGQRNGNTILHLAAMLSSAKKLSRFPSPALQMQSEMQRFKNAENILPWCKGEENKDNQTPMDLFVEEHRNLKNDGEKWLKETATSCSLLAMLIVTVMFSAAFTVPGGYENDTGRPVYLGSKYFTVFIISDALSLLFSSTSAMVFLGIYTSLFREEDFLKRLPLTLICGLFTLFLSITTMVIAFSAALILTLRGHFVWIALPVLMSASIPVIIYSVLNIPMFVNVLYSTLFSH